MALAGPGVYPAGFDIPGSPFADFSIENTVYRLGYEPFTLDEFCDGWIYFCPFRQAEVVSYVDGFYNDKSIDYARRYMPNPAYRGTTVEELAQDEIDDLVHYQSELREL